MLVLTRHAHESIVIGDDIEITILEVSGKTVELGINAPRAAKLPTILALPVDESMKIGDTVEVTILGVSGKTIKLGVSAPKDVSVHRSEVYVRINLPTAHSHPLKATCSVSPGTIVPGQSHPCLTASKRS